MGYHGHGPLAAIVWGPGAVIHTRLPLPPSGGTGEGVGAGREGLIGDYIRGQIHAILHYSTHISMS